MTARADPIVIPPQIGRFQGRVEFEIRKTGMFTLGVLA